MKIIISLFCKNKSIVDLKNNSKAILWERSRSPCPLAYEIPDFLICLHDYEKREEAKKTNSQKGISCHAFGCKQPNFTKIP